MDVRRLAIADVMLLTPRLFEDARGWFQETYSARALAAAGIDAVFVQDNHSMSQAAGTVRGLHFQIAPRPQGKLVRVIAGAVLDVAVDLRVGSPSYGQHVSTEISAANRCQIWIPQGFAHGFCTLEPNTEVVYKVTDYFAAECDRGIQWDDPDLGIAWPVSKERVILSDKDRALPALRQIAPAFDHF